MDGAYEVAEVGVAIEVFCQQEDRMASQINDLVAMGDIESLYDIMCDNEDWMVQLDAAEGLVKLGDRRGLEFLRSMQQQS